MDVNPYLPPRARDDDDGLGPRPHGAAPRLLPPEAAALLVSSGRWAHGIVLLAVMSLPLTVLELAWRADGPQWMLLVVGIPIDVLFVLAFRRYAVQARRLALGEPGAVDGLLDRQRAILKLHGLMLSIGGTLLLLLAAGAFAIGYFERERLGQ